MSETLGNIYQNKCRHIPEDNIHGENLNTHNAPLKEMATVSNACRLETLSIKHVMETARSSETLVNIYQTTWRHNAIHCHCHGNLKSKKKSTLL